MLLAGFAFILLSSLLAAPVAGAPAPPPPRFLALGDSYTIGQGGSPADRSSGQLAHRLAPHTVAGAAAAADADTVAPLRGCRGPRPAASPRPEGGAVWVPAA